MLTFESLEGFKHLIQFHRAQCVRVFGGNLNDDLEILANIDAKHLLHAGHRLFSCESAKVIDKPLQPEKSITNTQLNLRINSPPVEGHWCAQSHA
jgi:hypothetical protein